MNETRNFALIGATLAAFLLVAGSTYIVGEAEQAIVIQFGEIKKVVTKPGLKFKLPLIQDVQLFDKRLLDYNAEPRELITKDSERIVVDAFVRYRITNPPRYYVTVRNEQTMHSRLSAILESSIRQVIASVPLKTVLSADRASLMTAIRDIVNAQVHGSSAEEKAPPVVTIESVQDENGKPAAPVVLPKPKLTATSPREGYGIEIVDVRIMRSDLPAENSEAIYSRMRTEREREAREFRAVGGEEAVKIKADADRQRVITIAEAQKKSQIMRGEGDAQAAKIYNDAIGSNPKFFEQWRSLQAYRSSLKASNTSIVMSPGNGFLKEFDQNKSE